MEEPVDYIENVKEFMLTAGQPVVDAPEYMPKDRALLRLSLILEELREYAIALGLDAEFKHMLHQQTTKPISLEPQNLTEQFDALLDMQYVLSGAVIENGFADCFNTGFRAVHKSNMSKFCLTKEEALNTCVIYQKNKISCTAHEVGNYFVVLRDEDSKVLKSSEYKPVNLNPIINGALGVNAGNGSGS